MEKSVSFPYRKADSWQMFDRISGRYDFLNRFLSFGLDVGWRKRLAEFLPELPELQILDLATGTGDVLIYLTQQSSAIKKSFGIDMAGRMLTRGRQKVQRLGLHDRIQLMEGDINHVLQFEGNQFHAITIAFGIRNVEDPKQVLKEMFRLLKSDGRALILEFSMPPNPLIRGVYNFYLGYILPFLGALFSGDQRAYRYLHLTVRDFPFGKEFCRMMEEAGFKNIKETPLTFGVATIYQGEKIGK